MHGKSICKALHASQQNLWTQFSTKQALKLLFHSLHRHIAALQISQALKMDAALVKQVTALKDDPHLPINLKWTQIKALLKGAGLLWTSQEKPQAFLCHPSNCGGLMLSWHDMHAKGGAILSLGFDKEKLQRSVAFEIAADAATRARQFLANKELTKQAQGLVAPVTGAERFLTVASSHVCGFFRAVLAGCRTEEPSLKQLSNGILSLDACSAAPTSADGSGVHNPFKSLCLEGWEWEIISQAVEAAIPDLPAFLQQCLNTEKFHLLAPV